MGNLERFAEVVRTADLLSRPPQPRRGGNGGAHVAAIVREIPHSALRVLARAAAEALIYADAHSAGISVVTDHERPALERTAVVGPWATTLALTGSDVISPEGLAVSTARPQLFRAPHRYFRELDAAHPCADEMLCVPLVGRGGVRGVLWVVLHDDERQFDLEDVRRLHTLSQCASAAFDVARSLHDAPRSDTAPPRLIERETDVRPGARALSAREHAVVVGVARGYTNRQLADTLAVSVKTVDTYRARAADKLGLRDRAAFIAYAMSRGWLN